MIELNYFQPKLILTKIPNFNGKLFKLSFSTCQKKKKKKKKKKLFICKYFLYKKNKFE